MPRPFIPAPNCVSVEMIYGSYGQVFENVFHVQGSAPFTLSDLATLRGVFDSWHNVTAKPQIANNVILNRIRSKALDTGSSPFEDYSLPAPRAGTGAGPALTLNVTKAIKLATGLTGRSQRGRIYWPGVYGVQVSGNQMINATITAIVNALTTLSTNISAANAAWHLCVLSYRTGGAWRVTAQATNVTSIVSVSPNLDSMRRRLTGRGL